MTTTHQVKTCTDCPLCGYDWEMGDSDWNCQHPTNPAKKITYDDHGFLSLLEDQVADDCPLLTANLTLEVKK